MTHLKRLRTRRKEILEELDGLEEIRRGSVTDQYVEATRKDGTTIRRGPYPLYTFKDHGKTISQRLKTPELVTLYKKQIRDFRRFQELTAELLAIGEQFSVAVLSETEVKKTSRRKSRSKKTLR